MFPGTWTHLFFIIFNFLPLFKMPLFSFQRRGVLSSLLNCETEGKESINAHFESPLKKGIQDLKAGVLALWVSARPLVVTLRKGPGGEVRQLCCPVCPGFQQLIRRIPSLVVPQPSQHSKIITWIDNLGLELLQEVAGPFSLASWQAQLPGVFSQWELARVGQASSSSGVKLCPPGM